MTKYNHLDLFSGIGGFSLGLERTGCFQTIAFCEVDQFCKQILNKHWKGVKIYDDIKKLNGKEIEQEHGKVDIVTGGFPCQPYSVAGKQKGTNDSRYLWPEMFRIIRETKPEFVIGENVKGLINIQDGMVFETVCSDLESEGYEVQAYNIPACAVNAPHRRERIWIVAHSERNASKREIPKIIEKTESISGEYWQENSDSRMFSRTSSIRETSDSYMENSRCSLRQGSKFSGTNENENRKGNADQFERPSETREDVMANSDNTRDRTSKHEIKQKREEKVDERRKEQLQLESSRFSKTMANTKSEQSDSEHNRGEQGEVSKQEQIQPGGSRSWTLWEANWISEPDVGRVANGIPERAHRLKSLGNSIVPKIAEELARAIIEAKHVKS